MKTKLLLSMMAVAALAQEGSVEKPEKPDTSVLKAITESEEAKTTEQSNVDSFTEMFSEGKFSGQIRAGYVNDYPPQSNQLSDMALGGQLKYETAALYGLSFGAAMYTSNSLTRPSDNKFDNTLTSDNKNYTVLAESYVNFQYEGLDVKLGRQMLSTPLLDEDDWRMTPHTYEAYVASYTIEGFTFMAANVRNWQGVDTTDDNGVWDGNEWSPTGENNKGTNFGSAAFESDLLDASLWYYDVGDMTSAWYGDALLKYAFNDTFEINAGAQYTNQSQQNSSTLEGNAYGLWTELNIKDVIPGDIGLNAAYNKAYIKDTDALWGGFGGGPYFTNMEYMTLDSVAAGGDADVYVGGFVYSYGEVEFLYAYGDYKGYEATNTKAHVVEQDIGLSYEFNDNFQLGAVYSLLDDKENSVKTDFDTDFLFLRATYSF